MLLAATTLLPIGSAFSHEESVSPCKRNLVIITPEATRSREIERYAPGGYHPVIIGEVLHQRYRIAGKLGYGGYSTVWLARDLEQEQYVALKICAPSSPANETKILKHLSTSSSNHPGRNSVPVLLDEFTVSGPNGAHTCYTYPPARASLSDISHHIHLRNVLVPLPAGFHSLSIEDLKEKYGKSVALPVTRCDGQLLPPNVPKETALPLFMGCKADKMLLPEARIILSDFGEAYGPASEVRLGKDCNTPLPFRPPEFTFEPEAPLSYSADIRSLTTAIWKIIGMQGLFADLLAPEEEMATQHCDTLGLMPKVWWDSWEERHKFYDEAGMPKEGREVWPSLEESFEIRIQHFRRRVKMVEFDQEEAAAVLDLVRRMLALQPEERPTAEEVLSSEWMVKWALPELWRVEDKSSR
ncbi:kinase domain protein [Coprinopsis sp. MPI-PUGE-AT-0042]|nr:kinase domain protein [Coprinopsis sp. MPI-PUGE-AT-0042]